MIFKAEQAKVVVVGSSSIDLVLETEKIPAANETVIAKQYESFFGGKGANQAVAASRLGAAVYFVGAVGMDPYGQQVLRNLVDQGVNVGFVQETTECATGTAYVISSEGKTTVIVVPDANFCIKPKHVDLAQQHIQEADIVLLQLEIPMETVERTVQLAKRFGKKVALYASPAKHLSEELLHNVDFVILKNSELAQTFGAVAAEEILRKYPNKIFVRDDANSTAFFDGSEMKYLSDNQFTEFHKMGMGDAFTAGFSVAVVNGNSIFDSVKFGNQVALKVAQKRGSQTGLPYLKELS